MGCMFARKRIGGCGSGVGGERRIWGESERVWGERTEVVDVLGGECQRGGGVSGCFTNCNLLQCTAMYCNTMQRTATYCSQLAHH